MARAAAELASESGPFTWKDLMQRLPGVHPASPADRDLVRHTVDNMVKTGDLVVAGARKNLGRGRPANLYLPGDGIAPTKRVKEDTGAAIARLMYAWG